MVYIFFTGQCRLPDGSKYVGSWQAGKMHGQGRCLYASGDQYQGEWEDDARHGSGGCMYASGDKYKGKTSHALRLTDSTLSCQAPCTFSRTVAQV